MMPNIAQIQAAYIHLTQRDQKNLDTMCGVVCPSY